MHSGSIPRTRTWLPWVAVCAVFVYLASPSLTQSDRRNGNQQDREKVPLKTSYDQVSPVLLGQESFESMLRKDKADKASVMERQKRLLEERYDLAPRVDARVTMSRGKPIPVGPTAKLPSGMTWEKLASMSAEDIREQNAFPKGYLPLPHPHHEVGGMVFPQVEVKLLPRLERFDLDFDLPEHFLPEFPPAIYLTTRPDLGDVSQGKVLTIDNFQEIFSGILNSKDLEGVRLLVTQFPAAAIQRNLRSEIGEAQPGRGLP